MAPDYPITPLTTPHLIAPPHAVQLWGFPKPPPLRWAVEGFVPEGYVTILAADGGTGKSYLALLLSVSLALGRPFLGLTVTSAPVLYVDYELDATEQKRRLYRVAAGMGVSVDDEALAGRLFYYRPSHPLSDPRAHEEVVGIVRRHGVGLTILDSLTIGSAGADTTASDDVISVMQGFRDWGTVLAIDHLSKGVARGNQSGATPFGSVFKRNIARSTANLSRVGGGGLVLAFDKSNFGPKSALLCYEATFDDDGEAVHFRRVARTDAAMTGAEQHLDSYDTTLLAVEEAFRATGGPVSLDAVARWRAENDDVPTLAAGTLRNHLTVLERRGAVVRVGDGTVLPADVEGLVVGVSSPP